MATPEQRAQALADAILNKVATASQVNRLGAALARQDGDYATYSAASATVKAQMLVTKVRAYLLNVVKSTDGQIAATTALSSASSAVEAEFTETP